MNDEQWFDIIETIKEKLEIIDHHKEKIEIKDDFGIKGYGEREVIVFLKDGQKMKLEREKRPMILDKKVHYAKTKASGAMIELILSSDQNISRVHLYVYDSYNNNWKEINIQEIS